MGGDAEEAHLSHVDGPPPSDRKRVVFRHIFVARGKTFFYCFPRERPTTVDRMELVGRILRTKKRFGFQGSSFQVSVWERLTTVSCMGKFLFEHPLLVCPRTTCA